MICIIFAPPRTGKTCFLTHVLNTYMFDNVRNYKMQQEIRQKQVNGFEFIKTIPQHCVSSNYGVTGYKFRYSTRHSRIINPYKLGFKNKWVETHFNLPYEVIGITEAQKYLNSRMSQYFPDWQSRWYEQHGHNYLDIFLDTQRPGLIDVNIRELSHFIEIINLKKKYDKNGNITALTWTIRHIDNNALYERYISSGKKDSACYEQLIVTANYNVFECYESTCCKPKFYQGHFEEDIDYLFSSQTEETLDGYIEYLKNNDDELPDNFYQKRSLNK